MGRGPKFSEIQILEEKLNLLLDFFDIDRSIFEPDEGIFVVADQYGWIYIESSKYQCERYIRRYTGHLPGFRLLLMPLAEYESRKIWERKKLYRRTRKDKTD